MKKRLFALMLSVLLVLTSASIAFAVETTEEDAAVATGADFKINIEREDDDPVVYDFKTVLKNDRFTLLLDDASTFVCVVDNATGQKWYSNPPVATGSDPYAAGIAITDLRSVLGLTYTNSELQVKVTNNAVGSVNKGSYHIYNTDKELYVVYDFGEAKIRIPVKYSLLDTGLEASIVYRVYENDPLVTLMKEEAIAEDADDDQKTIFKEMFPSVWVDYEDELEGRESDEEETDEIKLLDVKMEYGTNTINKIEFMKYFGAAGEADEGYLVIPDGSGAIVEFNNKKNVNEMVYEKKFFGQDMALVTETDQFTSREETITLPIYGMVKNGYGMLAEVTSGAEMATLNAATSGNLLIGAYNVAYTTTVYRVNYSIPLMSQISSETSNAMYNAEDPTSLETYSVAFHFIEDQNANYITLANYYRDMLLADNKLTDDEVSERLYTEFYGAVNKKKSFAGILYTARETLTSFDDAKAILDDLTEGGVKNITALYQNFSDDYFDKRIETKVNASGSLGGQDGMTNLINDAAEKNIPVSVAADFMTIHEGGNDYSTFWDVADAINVSPIEVYPFSLNGNTQNLSEKPYYLIDPRNYEKGVNSLIDAAQNKGYTSYYFDDEALQLYSDLAPDGYQAERTSIAQAEQFKKIADTGVELTMSNPNVFLMAYADYLVDIPVCSSKEILFDGDIPFLQTVLRGLKNFGGESMNITDVSETSFLRHLEFGTDMKYSLINSESEALLNTELTFLYSATYDRSKYLADGETSDIETYAAQIKERYKAFEELGAAVGQSGISAHTREGNVSVTTYTNGAKVYVNYGSEAATVDGVTVEALSYKIV